MPRTQLYGTPVSPGIALGTLHFTHEDLFQDKRRIAPEEVASEQEKLQNAALAVRDDLMRILEKVPADLAEYREVIDAQIELTRDPKFVGQAFRRISQEGLCAAWAMDRTMNQICEVFRSMDDPYLRDRAQDVRVIGLRIRNRICGKPDIETEAGDIVLAAEDISPADVMELDLKRIRAIITREGGPTSHTAILARGLHIPALVSVTGLMHSAHEGDRVIVDGLGGSVIIDPAPRDTAFFTRRSREFSEWQASVRDRAQWPADTKDGVRVAVTANIERPDEADELKDFGADGVGLYRTEFSFMREHLPGEEELYREYSEVLRRAPGNVVFRTLDAGADKLLKVQETLREPNPALGLRGIRFTMRNRDIFKSQLSALLRAGAVAPGRMSILIPLVTNVEEVRSVRRLLQEIEHELEAHGIAHERNVPLGTMIETPAAALIADALARESDFFSIGTNDLIHYLLVIDRNNRHVAYLDDPMHPAVIRSLKRIIDAAHREGIGVCACGELSTDPFGIVLMVGMGIDTLSASPSFLPSMKHIVRNLDAEACRRLAREVLMSTDVPTCKHMANELLQETLGGELAFHTSTVAP